MVKRCDSLITLMHTKNNYTRNSPIIASLIASKQEIDITLIHLLLGGDIVSI